jgi:site-specific recombinase XerD
VAGLGEKRGNEREDGWGLDEFIASLTRASANTVIAYRGDVTDFVEWSDSEGISSPDKIDRLVLRRYLGHLGAQRFAKRTIARKASALRRYFAWARRAGRVTTDPSLGLRAPAGEGRLPRVLDGRELHELLEPEVVDERTPQWRRLRDDALLEMLYGSGLRVSELCNLDLDGVDLRRGVVTVWGKGGKERRVPMSQAAVDAVRSWMTARREVAGDASGTALFLNGRGGRVGTRDVAARRRLIHMPCATPSPLTSSTGEPICESCRNCSATATWPRLRGTRM